ncbi:hypothetical protein [Rhodococcus sp. NPDC058481]|uniref:hypothetical protein n=1 Tax=unclassified Rhodococcus (in: high G+C Gram-positive bacteria) TaxID=192944 RepID=UPI0036631645
MSEDSGSLAKGVHEANERLKALGRTLQALAEAYGQLPDDQLSAADRAARIEVIDALSDVQLALNDAAEPFESALSNADRMAGNVPPRRLPAPGAVDRLSPYESHLAAWVALSLLHDLDEIVGRDRAAEHEADKQQLRGEIMRRRGLTTAMLPKLDLWEIQLDEALPALESTPGPYALAALTMADEHPDLVFSVAKLTEHQRLARPYLPGAE